MEIKTNKSIMMIFTAIIPLRSGSQRILGKNTKLLAGKPLFTYTLDEALKADNINMIIITTDDTKVTDILQKNYNTFLESGKIKILIRDKTLSTNTSSSIDVLLDVYNKYKNINNIILLQGTSPLRNVNDINKALGLFINDSASVISVNNIVDSPYWQYKINSEGNLENLFDKSYLKYRSQDLPKTYIPNGSIYISSKESFIESGGFYGKKIIPYIMNALSSIDIDNIDEFEYCEYLLTKIKNEQK